MAGLGRQARHDTLKRLAVSEEPTADLDNKSTAHERDRDTRELVEREQPTACGVRTDAPHARKLVDRSQRFGSAE